MADDKDDVRRTLKYGSERYIFRHIPPVALLLLLGIAMQVWPPRKDAVFMGFLLAVASFSYIVFACLRYFEPGRPRLVLSTDGIHQRLSHGRILHIPWDEVQGVVSVDHTMVTVARMVVTTRDVPAIVVSNEFYEQLMPHQPWLRRPLNWGHFAEGRNGAVRILFRPDYLGTQAKDLRQAIETRWRAFSRHPNAKLPQREEPRRPGLLPAWLTRWALPAIVLLGVLPAGYSLWSVPEMSDATRSRYLDDVLDKSGVTARLAEGRMTRLRRGDVAAVGIPRCDRETTRNAGRLWMPAITAASCIVELSLSSGERAVAVFRLVTETQTVEYAYGKFRQQSWLVAAPLSLEEADTLLCRLGHCGPDTPKR